VTQSLEAGPGERTCPATVAGDIGMKAGHRLHLRDQPGPVALHRKVHGEIPSVGTDGRDKAHGAVIHRAPLVLGCGHAGPHTHAIPHLDAGSGIVWIPDPKLL
jgi:hypothetical protein